LPISAARSPIGPGAGDEHGARLPERSLTDHAHLLPRLRDDSGGLEQHAEHAERWVDLHHVLRLDTPPLGHEPVDLLDAALGVLPLRHMSHSPTAQLGHGTGSGPPDDAGHEVTLP
jgi:hypothetical protein